MQLLFKTTTSGVLISAQNQPFGGTTPPSVFTPVLYVGADGKLHGGFRVPNPVGATQVTSTAAVTDGAWHLATLIAGAGTQTLYLDGVAQGTVTGTIDTSTESNVAVGAGAVTGAASAPAAGGFFNGTISDIAVFDHPLTAAQVVEENTQRSQSAQLSAVALPQDSRSYSTVSYDPNWSRVQASPTTPARAGCSGNESPCQATCSTCH